MGSLIVLICVGMVPSNTVDASKIDVNQPKIAVGGPAICYFQRQSTDAAYQLPKIISIGMLTFAFIARVISLNNWQFVTSAKRWGSWAYDDLILTLFPEGFHEALDKMPRGNTTHRPVLSPLLALFYTLKIIRIFWTSMLMEVGPCLMVARFG